MSLQIPVYLAMRIAPELGAFVMCHKHLAILCVLSFVVGVVVGALVLG